MLKKGLNFSTVPSISAFVSLSFACSKKRLIFLFKIKANSSLFKYPLISYLIPSFFFFLFFLSLVSSSFFSSYNKFIKLLYFLYSSLNLCKLFMFSQSGISYWFIRFIQKVTFKYIAKVLSFSENLISFSINSIILSHSHSTSSSLSNPLVLSSSSDSLSEFVFSPLIVLSMLYFISFSFGPNSIGLIFNSSYLSNI